jgi:hypothetical protein
MIQVTMTGDHFIAAIDHVDATGGFGRNPADYPLLNLARSDPDTLPDTATAGSAHRR